MQSLTLGDFYIYTQFVAHLGSVPTDTHSAPVLLQLILRARRNFSNGRLQKPPSPLTLSSGVNIQDWTADSGQTMLLPEMPAVREEQMV